MYWHLISKLYLNVSFRIEMLHFVSKLHLLVSKFILMNLEIFTSLECFSRKIWMPPLYWNVYQNSSFVSKYILINSWTELTRSLEGWGWWFFMPSYRIKINIKMHFLYWNGVLTSNCVSHSIKMHSNNTPNLLCSNWLYSFILKLLG